MIMSEQVELCTFTTHISTPLKNQQMANTGKPANLVRVLSYCHAPASGTSKKTTNLESIEKLLDLC